MGLLCGLLLRCQGFHVVRVSRHLYVQACRAPVSHQNGRVGFVCGPQVLLCDPSVCGRHHVLGLALGVGDLSVVRHLDLRLAGHHCDCRVSEIPGFRVLGDQEDQENLGVLVLEVGDLHRVVLVHLDHPVWPVIEKYSTKARIIF